jgi:restriction system protein
MPIPNYQTMMLPLLQFLGDRKEHSIQEAVDQVSDAFQLTDEERRQLLPSGNQEVIRNRIGWARSSLA